MSITRRYHAKLSQVPLSEDEIAFLAFHIGAYLENNGPGSELVTATFLYVNYHDLYRITLDRIREEFRSTLSVVTNDQPLPWGPYEVNLVLLMGLSPNDRKAFRILFDSLTEVLSDSANVMKLSRCTSFAEFATQLNEMIHA